MPRITGSLASVNSVPTEGTIIVRSLELRPGSRFVVTGEPKIAVIKQGKFTIENVEAGPVQITIQGNGVTHDVRVHVPEEAEVDFLDLLGDVYEWEPAQVSAVKLAAREARQAAEEATRIAARFQGVEKIEGWVASASASETAAADSASAASASAAAASTSETDAATSAQAASESATAAGDSRDESGAFAERAEKAAVASEESATKSKGSATAAKASSDTAVAAAGRADKAAQATSADREATGTSAAAAAADADRAFNEAERAKQIAGGDYAPTKHTHTVQDVTDLPETITGLRGELEALKENPPFKGTDLEAVKRASGMLFSGETEANRTLKSGNWRLSIKHPHPATPPYLMLTGDIFILPVDGFWRVRLQGFRETGEGTISVKYAQPGGMGDSVFIGTETTEVGEIDVTGVAENGGYPLSAGTQVWISWSGTKGGTGANYSITIEKVDKEDLAG